MKYRLQWEDALTEETGLSHFSYEKAQAEALAERFNREDVGYRFWTVVPDKAPPEETKSADA